MLLEVKHLVKEYSGGLFRRNVFTAVNDVSFNMEQGEILGLMGHSGCGKTTISKMIAHLIMPTSGQIYFAGKNIVQSSRRRIIEIRRELQIIFQNPKLALNPNYNIRQQIVEPIRLFSLARNRHEIDNLVSRSMDSVGLSQEIMYRYPNEISGGQAQRVAIARSLCLGPRLLIADEATSMLDLSIQAQIIELFKEIHRKHNISILMISHDKNVVEHFCDRIIVMDKGKMGLYAPVKHPSVKHPS
jgi:ABC-type oligopeptide transport system ATPase subunit